MNICKVIGNIVCTQKAEILSGNKLLIIRQVNPETMDFDGKEEVAVDSVGAGVGEFVMTVGGSSARLAKGFEKSPVDRTIVGIVDFIQVYDKTTYSK
jgi:microcompartment protein CcmK/EutM